MKPGCLIAALVAALLVSCGGGTAPADSPEASFAAAKKAAANRDFAAMVELIAPSARAQLETQWKQGMEGGGAEMTAKMLGKSKAEVEAMSFKDFLVAMMEKKAEEDPDDLDSMEGAEILDKQVEGDLCTLTVKQKDGKEDKVTLVREGGKWYLTSPGG